VIFDFNGTLSDDEPILLEIFTELFAAQLGWQMTVEQYYGRLAGRSDREIIETAVAEQGAGDAGLVEDMLRRRREMYKEKRIPMGIVTGAQREDILAVLDRSPAGEFIAALVTEEDVAEGKPHPEGFTLGARALGLSPGQILVFEDSVHGVRAAMAAGMPCVAVTGTQGSARLAEVTSALVPCLDASLLDL
jgi:beta-phosphoglucomutase